MDAECKSEQSRRGKTSRYQLPADGTYLRINSLQKKKLTSAYTSRVVPRAVSKQERSKLHHDIDRHRARENRAMLFYTFTYLGRPLVCAPVMRDFHKTPDEVLISLHPKRVT